VKSFLVGGDELVCCPREGYAEVGGFGLGAIGKRSKSISPHLGVFPASDMGSSTWKAFTGFGNHLHLWYADGDDFTHHQNRFSVSGEKI
jgi:hypothetical protein